MASDDGGKTFRNSTLSTANGVKGSMHEDFHSQWIDPANSDHMISGNDGGMQTTWDGGAHWELHNNVAIGQFYGISYDFKRPYNICGGLQDNDSWCGPSASLIIRGISNDEWTKVGGGDGMYSQVDPNDPNWIYSDSQDGNITRRDLRTQQSRSIRPREDDEKSPRYRFQWTSPFIISHFDSKTLYLGGNYVFKSTDRGDSWTRLGPDLTTGADRNKIPILGKMPSRDMLSRNDGVTSYPNITTISESAARAGVLWAGTDDGNVQITRDGKTWTNITIPGVPKGTYVSRVLASKYADGTAFVAFDGHRSNDFNPYLFMTTDFGEHWTSVSAGINGSLHVIVEHFRNQNLLFAGTEFGLFVSFNGGKNWQELKNNLPRVPVDDILIHPRDNDLIIGTHGRSIWILDDITPLEQLSDEVLTTEAHLFDVRPAAEWRMMDAKTAIGHAFFVAENPPYGALITFLAGQASGRVATIDILNSAGKVVRTMRNLAVEPGLNRTAWDLRTDAPASGGGGRGGQPRGVLVAPGEYTIRLTVGSSGLTTKVTVEDDLRITLSPEDRARRTQAVTELFDMAKESGDAERSFTAFRTSLAALRTPSAARLPEAVAKAVDDVIKKMDGIEPTPSAERALDYVSPPVSQRIIRLLGAIDAYAPAPTADQLTQIRQLRTEMTDVDAKMKQIVADELPRLNKLMNDAGVPHITAAVPPR
jgi:hypothetical protein